MKLAYPFREEDLLVYLRHFYEVSPAGTQMVRRGRLTVPVLLVVAALVLHLAVGLNLVGASFFAGYAVFWWLSYPRFFRWLVARRTLAWARRDRGTPTFGDRVIHLDERGLRIEAGSTESRIAWDGLAAVERFGGHLLLYLDSRQAIVVPLEAAEPAADREVFAQQCINRKLA